MFQQHPPGMFAPSSNVRAVQQDLKLFRHAGVELMTVECEDLFGAGINDDPVSADMQSFMPLRTWVGLKLMNDPDRDLNELLDTFCRGYYGPAAKPMRELLELIETRQAALPTRVVDVQRHEWLAQFCDTAFFESAYRLLDEATRSMDFQSVLSATNGRTRPNTEKTTAEKAEDSTGWKPMLRHILRERIIIDSAFLWLEQHIRRQAGANAKWLPQRAALLARHRADWQAYLATVFDDEGQRLAWPIIESGLALLEKLQLADTRYEHLAAPITETDVMLDGRLDEAFWQRAESNRLLPRDPAQPFDNPASVRFAWTSEALYVGIEQPADRAFASIGVALQRADRKEIQLTLYAPQRAGALPLNAYFYEYDDSNSLRHVKDRKSSSQCFGHSANNVVTTELRFVWSDIALDPQAAINSNIDSSRRFVINLEAYPQPDSKAPTHVSSPWLIGKSPAWHSGYFGALRLGR